MCRIVRFRQIAPWDSDKLRPGMAGAREASRFRMRGWSRTLGGDCVMGMVKLWEGFSGNMSLINSTRISLPCVVGSGHAKNGKVTTSKAGSP
jgi:hypothetical protein